MAKKAGGGHTSDAVVKNAGAAAGVVLLSVVRKFDRFDTRVIIYGLAHPLEDGQRSKMKQLAQEYNERQVQGCPKFAPESPKGSDQLVIRQTNHDTAIRLTSPDEVRKFLWDIGIFQLPNENTTPEAAPLPLSAAREQPQHHQTQ